MKYLIAAAVTAMALKGAVANAETIVIDLGCRTITIHHHEYMTEEELQRVLEENACKPKVLEPRDGDEDRDGRDDYNSPAGGSECSGGGSDGVDDDAPNDDAGSDTGDTDSDAGGDDTGGNNGGNPCGGNCGNGQGNGGGNGTGNEGNGRGPNK